jgi:Putative 8-oxoguanine DNA glycosylase OGG-like protein
MTCRERHLAFTVVCPGSQGCYCRVVVDDPMPFRGPPPSRDQWVLGQSVPFSPDKWRDQLPSCDLWPPELDGLSSCGPGRWPRVDRRTVFRVGERAAQPLGAAQTLVAAAVWGTGTQGFGRARRLRVFDGNADEVGSRLAAAVRIMGDDGAVKAYGYLHGDGRNLIRHLGPSFGTKFLYFAGYDRASGGRRPLILDQYVALAVCRLCGVSWPATGWSTRQYADYLDRAHGWAGAWHTSPDVIERVLFSAGKADPLVLRAFTGLRPAGEAGR